jgi:hypothetical protein
MPHLVTAGPEKPRNPATIFAARDAMFRHTPFFMMTAKSPSAPGYLV